MNINLRKFFGDFDFSDDSNKLYTREYSTDISRGSKTIIFNDKTVDIGICTIDDLNETGRFELDNFDDLKDLFKKKNKRFVYCAENVVAVGLINNAKSTNLLSLSFSSLLDEKNELIQIQIVEDRESESSIIIYYNDNLINKNLKVIH